MKTKSILFASSLCLLFFFQPSAYALDNSSPQHDPSISTLLHNELVGTFVFEKYADDLLLLTATVEKKQFVNVLKKEGSCELKDMMRVCGNQYLIQNFNVIINNQTVSLKEESLSIEKDFITLTYTIPISQQAIKQIKVTSDYMFKYNDHALLKVIFDMTGRPRIYNIKNKKRAIIAKF